MGQRWEDGKQWNLKLENEQGEKIDPSMSVVSGEHEIVTIQFPYFDNAGNGVFERPIAVRKVTLANGEEVLAATIYDLMTSQYGVKRFNHPLESKDFNDAESFYTPAWQEKSDKR